MGGFVSLLRGCFPVGEFYLREVLSHNSSKVASFYQAIFEKFCFLKSGLRGSTSPLMKLFFTSGG